MQLSSAFKYLYLKFHLCYIVMFQFAMYNIA
jgi:hypothetical protein